MEQKTDCEEMLKPKKTDMLRRTSASKKSVKSVLRNRDRICEKIFEGSMKDF